MGGLLGVGLSGGVEALGGIPSLSMTPTVQPVL